MWTSLTAWQVTIFMGIQSLMFYTALAWLPEILQLHGYSSNEAGWIVSLMIVATIPFMFFIPVVADLLKNQIVLAILTGLSFILGVLGLLYGSYNFVTIYVILIGVGCGSGFSLTMMFFSLRTNNGFEAAELSGMAQSFGYTLAATGPVSNCGTTSRPAASTTSPPSAQRSPLPAGSRAAASRAGVIDVMTPPVTSMSHSPSRSRNRPAVMSTVPPLLDPVRLRVRPRPLSANGRPRRPGPRPRRAKRGFHPALRPIPCRDPHRRGPTRHSVPPRVAATSVRPPRTRARPATRRPSSARQRRQQ